jgi:toxin ParE1/3/4
MRHYRLTSPAELDYVDILATTLETWGLLQFEKYGNLLDSTFQKLAENPNLGKSKDYIPEGCLLYLVKSHRIVYRVVNGDIEILRLFHKSQSVTRKLF